MTPVEPDVAPETVVPAGQVVVRPGLAATTNPPGKVSPKEPKEMLVAAVALGLLMANVRVELAPTKMLLGLKDLDTFSGT